MEAKKNQQMTQPLSNHIRLKNKVIAKNQEYMHSAKMQIDCIFGLQNKKLPPIAGNPIIFLNKQQILYFTCNTFIIMNLSSKQYHLIPKYSAQISNNAMTGIIGNSIATSIGYYDISFMKKINKTNSNTTNILAVELHEFSIQLYILAIDENSSGSLSSTQKMIVEQASFIHSKFRKSFNLKSIKIGPLHPNTTITAIEQHSKKHYLYFLLNQRAGQSSIQHILIYDITTEKVIFYEPLKFSNLNHSIKLSHIIPLEESNEIYLMGKNYFRFWVIDFNYRSIKESNHRNIERALKNLTIIGWTHFDKNKKKSAHPYHNFKITQSREPFKKGSFFEPNNLKTESKTGNETMTNFNEQNQINSSPYLLIICEQQFVKICNNQIVFIKKPQKIVKNNQNKNNLNSEEQLLQTSLNQLYKMKYFFGSIETKQDDAPSSNKALNEVQKKQQFTCLSQIWLTDKQHNIAIGTNTGKTLLYKWKLNHQIKLQSQYVLNPQISTSIQSLYISDKAQMIVSCNSPENSVYIINRSYFNTQNEFNIEPLWGSEMHNGNIISLDSAPIRTIMASVGDDSCLKLWNTTQKSITLNKSYKNKILSVSIHPSGHILAINFDKQIKLLSIVSTQFYEITSLKNLHQCVKVQYSHNGNFLLCLQSSRIKFYEPFTLKSLGYIEAKDFKVTITDFVLTKNDEYIFFQCSDFSIWRKKIDLDEICKGKDPLNIIFCHNQSQAYTAFYFDNLITHDDFKCENLFIGFTTKKYITLYSEHGTNLITEFGVYDCTITCFTIVQNLLFLGTSKGTIRVYNWPIIEENCMLQIADAKTGKLRFCHPKFNELCIWHDKTPIKCLQSLKYSHQLVITNKYGNISLVHYYPLKKNKSQIEQISQQRKKVHKMMNQFYLVKSSQLQKRQKLVQKTQNDILKVENEIIRERNNKEQQLKQDYFQMTNIFEKKNYLEGEERQHCVKRQQKQLQLIQVQLQSKLLQFEEENAKLQETNHKKIEFQQTRNQKMAKQIEKIIVQHKENLEKEIENHQMSIRKEKQYYQNKVRQIQGEFQKYAEQLQAEQSNKENLTFEINTEQLQQHAHIILLQEKVEDLEKSNEKLGKELFQNKQKVSIAKKQDEELQKKFQSHLQEYNTTRFQNLCLHSEVLKMQNQLIERNQILVTKQEVISLAYTEKCKLENYRQLVKGCLNDLQDKKEDNFKGFTRKQNGLHLIFSELIDEIKKYDEKKKIILDLNKAKSYYNAEIMEKQQMIQQKMIKLKELKRYLLLQSSNQDQQGKKLYQERENLITSINWLKKRMHIATLTQKKNNAVKRATLGLVLKQNKNLIEECNQLRSQGIQYEKQMRNLRSKFKEVMQILSLENKLKNQKHAVEQQKTELLKMKQLFQDPLEEKQEHA